MTETAQDHRNVLPHWWIIPLAMAITALTFFTTPSSADSFPDNHHDGLADSSTHTYCFQSWVSDASVGHYAMRDILDDTTDMSDSYSTTCTTSTDVVFRDVNLGGSLRGRYTCMTWYSNDRCNYSIVELDFAQIDIGSNDWHDRRKTSGHEVGHSVGTNHDTISMMISGSIPDTSVTWRRFSSHDITHVDASY